MLCSRPFRQGVTEFGCGQCLPCRLNRRRLWTSRLMLESRKHAISRFVTLTYSEKNIPEDGSVDPVHMQLFMKRLRRRLGKGVRFYGVGEYGDETFRPHYHLAIFGMPVQPHLWWGDANCSCFLCGAWREGRVHTGEINEQTCAYIAGYVTKKLTSKDDPRLGGRHPEFARMSLRPGIGAQAVPDLHRALVDGTPADTGFEDVPTAVRASGRLWPLGRYLRRKWRAEMGMAAGEPSHIGARRSHELQGKLRSEGGRVRRENTRIQHARKAASLEAISKSKKLKGL